MIKDRSYFQYKILKVINENKGINRNKIAKNLHLSKHEVYLILKTFKRFELIKKLESDDMRITPFVITNKGSDMLNVFKKVVEINHNLR